MKFTSALLLIAAANATHEEEGDWEETWDEEWDPCACLGYDALPTDWFAEQGYDPSYGSYCWAWDAESDACKEGGEAEDEVWCDDDYNWCYVDPSCYDSNETVYFDDTPYEDMLNWRECKDWDSAGASNLVAAFATAFAVASVAL